MIVGNVWTKKTKFRRASFAEATTNDGYGVRFVHGLNEASKGLRFFLKINYAHLYCRS